MSQVQQVKDATDIVEIIGAHIELKRSGSNLKGLCPFHGEKSPSFFVSETMQRYKCFGCGETGDVFTFLEKYESMTFYEALEHLAEKAGITLEKATQNSEDMLRNDILEVLDLAKDYYHFLLTKHLAGRPAREYLKERGVTSESLKLFQVGYAVDSWEGVLKYLHGKKKYSISLIEKAGLIVKGKYSRYYDRFRGRIIFPLKNHRGQVVGFSGRLLEKDAKSAKYINSPETLVYHKSQMLFGYSELFQSIREKNKVIVVEGEFDVISSQQAHVNNIVAIKGSSLTDDHVKLLSRTVDTILLALDTDTAGQEATRKAIQIIRNSSAPRAQDLELRIIVIPQGKDPDDLIKSNPKEWREATKTSISAYEFLIRSSLSHHDPASPEGKRRIMEELAPVLSGISHAVEQDFYIKRLAEALGVTKELILRDMKSFQEKGSLAPVKPKETHPPEPMTTRKRTIEEYALFLLLRSDASQIPQRARDLKDIHLETPGADVLVERLSDQVQSKTIQEIARSLPGDLQTLMFSLFAHDDYSAGADVLNISEEWQRTVKDLKRETIKQRIGNITRRLGELDEKSDKTPEEIEEQNQLLREIVQLRKE